MFFSVISFFLCECSFTIITLFTFLVYHPLLYFPLSKKRKLELGRNSREAFSAQRKKKTPIIENHDQ